MRRTVLLTSFWTVFIFAVYSFIGVRQTAPDTINKGDVCFKCRRPIHDVRLAAESMGPTLPTKYRTPGCMAAYVATHPADDERYFVTDYISGGLVDARRAHFVPVLINDQTGERDYRAYYSRRLAERTAGELGVGVYDWESLVTRARARLG